MSRLRLAKINVPSSPPATTAEIFYNTANAKMSAIDEAGNVISLGGFTGAAADYRLIRVFWITASGTYGVGQAISMTAGTRALYVEAVGAGGGGGSAPATSANASASGGGGAGAYVASWIVIPAPGTTNYAVTIGAGGAAGTGGGPGGNGGDTLFGSLITAKGGGLAGSTTAGTGPAMVIGGSTLAGSVGDVIITGGIGGSGVIFSATLACAGNGGNSLFGSGNAAPVFVATSGSAAGRGSGQYGGGGTGGANVGTQGASTAVGGANGACRIWEFA